MVPTACNEAKHLLTHPTQGRKKKVAWADGITHEVGSNVQSDSDHSIESAQFSKVLADISLDDKMFRIIMQLHIEDRVVILRKCRTQTDQESDLNVITITLAIELELELHYLHDIEVSEMSMKTASPEQQVPLRHYVKLNLSVFEIKRHVILFVSSGTSLSKDGKMDLLLELTRLHQVNAYIVVRVSILTMGDESVGEVPVEMGDPDPVF